MIAQRIIEVQRLVMPEEFAFAGELEAQAQQILRKLFPSHDWANKPILVKFGDPDYPNAAAYSAHQPPVVTITRGLLKFARSEDDIAWVLAHELAGHKSIRDYLGHAFPVTMGEEIASDVLATLQCVEVGYNYRTGIDFFKRRAKLRREDFSFESWDGIHPFNATRLTAMEIDLSYETLLRRGRIPDLPTTPLTGPMTHVERLNEMKHRPFIERETPPDFETLPPTKQLEIIREFISRSIVNDTFFEAPRGRDIAALLSKVRVETEDKVAANHAHEILMLIHNERPYDNDFDGEGIIKNHFDLYLRIIANVFEKSPVPLHHLGPLEDMALSLRQLDEAQSIEEAQHACVFVKNSLEAAKSYFQARDAGLIAKGLEQPLAYHSTVIQKYLNKENLRKYYAAANQSDLVAETLWVLGAAFDRDFWDVLSLDTLRKLREQEDIRPCSGYKPVVIHGTACTGDEAQRQLEQYQELRPEIDVYVDARGRRELAQQSSPECFLSNPEHFILYHQDAIFPRRVLLAGVIGRFPKTSPPKLMQFYPTRQMKVKLQKQSRHLIIYARRENP